MVVQLACRCGLSCRMIYAHTQTLSRNELKQSPSQPGFCMNSEARGKTGWFWGLMTVHATPV
jgi:hypothetical protein